MAKSIHRNNLPVILAKCANEEEVKANVASAFNIKYDTKMHMDLYTSTVLFEFKYDKNMQNLKQRSKIIAQMLYYIRELKINGDLHPIPPYLCGIDKDEAFFVQTSVFSRLINDDKNKYDWDRAASTPCPKLVESVARYKATKNTHIYKFDNNEDYDNFCDNLIEKLNYSQMQLFELIKDNKKIINESNFDKAFSLWDSLFGDYVRNGIKSSKYFIADIQQDRNFVVHDKNEVAFMLSDDKTIIKPIPMKDYLYFWNTYSRCTNKKTINAIWQRLDRLTVEEYRRFTGEFYTPIPYAIKAIEYIERTVGTEWWRRGYRLWDMAAGTGNLEYMLPEESLQYCYMSSLLEDDVSYCKKIFPSANCFQYDYLNDDVNLLFKAGIDVDRLGIPTKMPEQLRKDLNNPNIKWIIFINPPFATANSHTEKKKSTISMTQIRNLMNVEGLGESSRELFTQFLWRISKEFNDKCAFLGLFSTPKYMTSDNDQKIRDSFFRYEFKSGFIFNARNFSGNSKIFPVCFAIWDLYKRKTIESQKILLDIFCDIDNDSTYKVGIKELKCVRNEQLLSKWCPRYRNSNIMPPFSDAISIAENNKDVRDRVTSDFLFSMMALGNDFQQQMRTALFSGPGASAGAFSVTPNNFERALVTYTVRKLPKENWLNNRDQWLQPTKKLPEGFVSDCVVWALFSTSNNTASLKNVKYKGNTYQIKNELYPYSLEEIKNWHISLSVIEDSLLLAKKNRFACDWLSKHYISTEAREVLDNGKIIYRYFYEHSSEFPWKLYKIDNWDLGWYQIRMVLKHEEVCIKEMNALKASIMKLGEKIIPQIRKYGFLSGYIHLFEE
ncbi:hypothetical protein [Butyrivibrio sp. WCD3002]|uniref:hypothetical protein n=1 Tax=Butyrivibrio sp. WCD3002 TaxID=1280676 RepID=UPI000403F8B2|nr:hypothetical protein [Butyrivibrio sp. WCD3002]